MIRPDAPRRLRAAIRYALTWGAGWFAVGLLLTGAFQLAITGTTRLGDMIGMAARFGVVGSVAGFAFAGAVGLLYHGRRLRDLSWWRVGLAGAVVTGVLVPAFLQAMNLLSGDGMVPWALVLDDVPLTAVLGGLAAGGMVLLAQRADAARPAAGLPTGARGAALTEGARTPSSHAPREEVRR